MNKWGNTYNPQDSVGNTGNTLSHRNKNLTPQQETSKGEAAGDPEGSCEPRLLAIPVRLLPK